MEGVLAAVLLLLSLSSPAHAGRKMKYSTCSNTGGSIYGYNVQSLDETSNKTMGEMYKGKVLMVINVATY